MLKAKELILDFINYAFLLILISFCIFYFTIGQNFLIFGEFLKAVLPLSLFGIVFLIGFKLKRKAIFTLNSQGLLEEVITYVTKADLIKDKLAITLAVASIWLINLIDRFFNLTDFLQGVAAFVYIWFWHKILFKSKEEAIAKVVLSNFDKIKDEVALYIWPLIIVGLGATRPGNLIVDLLQGFLPFSIMYIWHFILFQEK